MTRCYTIIGAICIVAIPIAGVLGGGFPWGWLVALALSIAAACERADLEAARRTTTFLSSEVDKLLAGKQKAANDGAG